MTRAKNGNGIAISHCPPTKVTWGAPHHGIASWLAVMDVQTMNDNISNILDRDASSISNVDIDPTGVNGLEAVHYELLLQFYNHVTLEHNPERLVLDNSMAQSARLGVDSVIVAGVGDHIEAAITATYGISSKSNATVCKALAVTMPVGVTAPAVVNGIAGSA